MLYSTMVVVVVVGGVCVNTCRRVCMCVTGSLGVVYDRCVFVEGNQAGEWEEYGLGDPCWGRGMTQVAE